MIMLMVILHRMHPHASQGVVEIKKKWSGVCFFTLRGVGAKTQGGHLLREGGLTTFSCTQNPIIEIYLVTLYSLEIFFTCLYVS